MTKITDKQLKRLKEYKAWLDETPVEIYYPGPETDVMIKYSIKKGTIKECDKEVLNEIEKQYQHHLLMERK